MLSQKIIHFLVVFQILLSESKETFQGNSFLLKLVNHSQSTSDQNVGKKNKPIEVDQEDIKCKYKCMGTIELKPKFVGQTQARFIDQGTNDLTKNSQMEAPAGKFSVFNLFSDEEKDDDQNDDIGDEETVKQEEEEEEEEGSINDDDIFNFFIPDDEFDSNTVEGTKQESLLKQYHRHRLRMHNLMFPLLLAYKLKFFTVIPLLLGSLVLLVGTTGVAGFFFALFAAALGIHVKSHEH